VIVPAFRACPEYGKHIDELIEYERVKENLKNGMKS